MNRAAILEKVGRVPEKGLDELAELLDWFLEKFEMGESISDELSEAEVIEINRRADAWEADPTTVIPYEEFEEKLRKRYGL